MHAAAQIYFKIPLLSSRGESRPVLCISGEKGSGLNWTRY
jgi:hypothetical protein